MDKADGMVHRSVTNQQTRKSMGPDHFDDRVLVRFHVHPNDLGARRHDDSDRTIRQAENSFDHFLFLGDKNARLRSLGDQRLDLVFGDGCLAGSSQTQKAQDPLG